MAFTELASPHFTGRKLRELVLAFQRTAVEWVKEQPEEYQGNGVAAFVQQIELKSVERRTK